MLEADEVLSIGGVGRDASSQATGIPRAPSIGGEVAGASADRVLVDLEPVTRTIVGTDIVTRGPGHVDQSGTWISS